MSTGFASTTIVVGSESSVRRSGVAAYGIWLDDIYIHFRDAAAVLAAAERLCDALVGLIDEAEREVALAENDRIAREEAAEPEMVQRAMAGDR